MFTWNADDILAVSEPLARHGRNVPAVEASRGPTDRVDICMQASHGDGYWTHPAQLDAATHFGAVADTDAVWRNGTAAAARVPVGLGAYAVALPTSALVRLRHVGSKSFGVSWPCCRSSRLIARPLVAPLAAMHMLLHTSARQSLLSIFPAVT